ncbi:hypothetical protein SAMD00019534_050440, partial [Acytostelium subglobosum LB1]|uniref:hypothetical protein n=1 Tax=Acytostelium subglobosum LB1 TaxID=1410327 RepID=UPI000644A12A
MTMKNYLLPLCVMVCISVVAGSQCTSNYQCGSFPFAVCYNLTSNAMLTGIGWDSKTSDVVFISRLSGVGSNVFKEKPFLTSLAGSFHAVEEINAEIDVPNGVKVYQLYNYMSDAGIPILANFMPTGVAGVGPYTRGVFEQVFSVLSVQLTLDYDEPNNILYSCDLDVRKYSPIPMTRDGRLNNVTMYKDLACSGLSHQKTDLFLAASPRTEPGTVFYKGSTSCVNCDTSKLVKLFTDPNYIRAFATNSEYIFYATSAGVFQVPLSGDVSKRVQVMDNTQVQSLVVGNEMLNIQTTDAIYRYCPHRNNTKMIYSTKDQISQGQCSCATGFAGDACTSCDGHVIWSNAEPRCVRKGGPSQCFEDYHCGNPPFTQCLFGSCGCRFNFTGVACDQCKGTITWQQGVPVCTL